MNDIKPIQTYYDGHLFRSRLEARWAVFFNSGHIKYEYEPEGFILRDGTKYLPDFYLPQMDIYVEVKRDTPDGIHEVVDKCYRAIEWGGQIKKLLILSNVPEGKSPDGGMWHFPILYWHADKVVFGWAFFYDHCEKGVTIGIPQDIGSDWHLWRNIHITHPTLGPMTDYAFRHTKICGDLSREEEIWMQETSNSNTFHAFAVARAARFEHGEHPPV